MKRNVLFLTVLFLAVTAQAKIEKVYLIPFSHQDIGFTGTQQEVAQFYSEMYDDLPDFMESFPDFKFTVETFWQFDCWLKSNPEPYLVDLYRHYAREGRIEFGSAYGSMHTGFTNDYVLSKSMERALNFARESGFEIAVCLMNDVPGFSADLPDVLAEKGIMYFMSGINDVYGSALGLEGSHNLFYWQGPLGNRILCWISKDSYAEGYLIKNMSMLRNYLNNLEETGYPYSEAAIMIAFDNAGYFPGAVAYLDIFKAWDDPETELLISTPSQFMNVMEEKYGKTLETYSGDWSGWWEVVKSGGPSSAGQVRRVQEFARELDEELERTDPELKSSMDLNLVMYGEHTSAVTAGWPGKLTLAKNITSNISVVGFAVEAYRALEKLLEKMTGQESLDNELYIIAPHDGEFYVEIPAETREGECLQLEISGMTFTGFPFHTEYTDSWDSNEEGYFFFLPLKKGVNSALLNGYRKETATEENVGNISTLDYKQVEDGSIEVTVASREGQSLQFDLRFESYLTGEPMTFLPSGAKISSQNRSSDGLREVVTLGFDQGPLSQISLTVYSHGGIEIRVAIDKEGLPLIPYADHSINYVLALGFDDITGIEYMGARSFTKLNSGLAGERPPFIPFESFVILDRSGKKTLVASRQSFSFTNGEKLRFQLLRHYSYSATSDLGITLLGENEPGTPKVQVFSFYIDTFEGGGFERASGFISAPFVITATSREER